jgi:uncharacterized RDD family membrane protein YckC
MVAVADESHPGARLGLPLEGHGSLASWQGRIGALIIDWAACTGGAVLLILAGLGTGDTWRAGLTLALFLLQSTVLSWLAGGSLGQLICRLAVVRLDRQHLGLPRAVLRALLVSLALPALVIGPDRRHLADLAVGTAVINRR